MAAAHWYSTALTQRGQSVGSMAGPRAVRTELKMCSLHAADSQ